MSKIIGQDKLIKEVNRIFQVFVNSNCKIRPHFILTGESGSGKSFTIKQLCDMNELSFLEVNAAQITKEGISGNSLSKILSPLVNYSHTPIVVFVDEFDKLFINGNTNSQLANESTASVQNEFLKLLESDTTSVFGDYGKYISVPIDNVLFVFAGGTFLGELKVLKERYPNSKFIIIVCHAVNNKGLINMCNNFDQVIVSNSHRDINYRPSNENLTVIDVCK